MNMDKILIQGLDVNAIIGILPHEREFEQPLKLDITLFLPLQGCARSGDLSLSINYAEVCSRVTTFIRERKAELIETLAEEVCQYILKTFKPQAVTLSIIKTRAVVNTQGVGVEITRNNED